MFSLSIFSLSLSIYLSLSPTNSKVWLLFSHPPCCCWLFFAFFLCTQTVIDLGFKRAIDIQIGADRIVEILAKDTDNLTSGGWTCFGTLSEAALCGPRSQLGSLLSAQRGVRMRLALPPLRCLRLCSFFILLFVPFWRCFTCFPFLI